MKALKLFRPCFEVTPSGLQVRGNRDLREAELHFNILSEPAFTGNEERRIPYVLKRELPQT